jgi:formylglycine-generating enzyme required for sulfatase activity
MLYGSLRMICGCRPGKESRLLAPVVCCVALIFGSEFARIYIGQRVKWIFNRALLQQASKDGLVRDSSIIFLQFTSITSQNITGIYAFAGTFGEVTRLVISMPPPVGNTYSPAVIRLLLAITTVAPNEFRRINPSGPQVHLEVERLEDQGTGWDLVRRYLARHWFGTAKDEEDFLASLCTIKTSTLKEESPLVPAIRHPLTGAVPPARIPEGDFSNGAAMEMVWLADGWWASKYETTQAQYLEIMKKNPSLFLDPLRPVECVSWHDAAEFCRRLSQREQEASRIPSGFVYRLPTVAEFDHLSDGNSLLNAVTAVFSPQWHTAPVGTLAPNSLGLHDVIGNVWEWCQDWWDENHRFKVSKGGSWVDDEALLTFLPVPTKDMDWSGLALLKRMVGESRHDYPDQGLWDTGFRCVLAPEKMPPAPSLERK